MSLAWQSVSPMGQGLAPGDAAAFPVGRGLAPGIAARAEFSVIASQSADWRGNPFSLKTTAYPRI